MLPWKKCRLIAGKTLCPKSKDKKGICIMNDANKKNIDKTKRSKSVAKVISIKEAKSIFGEIFSDYPYDYRYEQCFNTFISELPSIDPLTEKLVKKYCEQLREFDIEEEGPVEQEEDDSVELDPNKLDEAVRRIKTDVLSFPGLGHWYFSEDHHSYVFYIEDEKLASKFLKKPEGFFENVLIPAIDKKIEDGDDGAYFWLKIFTTISNGGHDIALDAD